MDVYHLAGPIDVTVARRDPVSGQAPACQPCRLGRCHAPAVLTESDRTLALSTDDGGGKAGNPAATLFLGRLIRVDLTLETWDEAALNDLVEPNDAPSDGPRGLTPDVLAAHPDIDFSARDDDGTGAVVRHGSPSAVGTPTRPVTVTLSGLDRVWRIPAARLVNDLIRTLGMSSSPLRLTLEAEASHPDEILWFSAVRRQDQASGG